MFTLDKLLCRGEFLRKRAAFTAVLVITSALAAGPVFAGPDTALDDYVNEPDPVYRFDPIGLSIPFADFTVHNLRVISQQWRSPEEVDQTVWDHLLTIIVPRRVVSETSLMFVLGGNNPIQLPDLDSDALQALALIATSSGTVVSALQQVPNQPLMFADDPISNNMRSEDQLVAFTFDRATRTGDYTWPAYLPMVKSVVRAMDAVQDFVPDATDAAVNITHFVVTGFSKRGATAWLTAAVDDRVVAVAPGVFDVLNWAPSLENHRASYGFISDALRDYQEFDLIDRLRTPEGRDLLQIVDPFSYRDRLTMPKYILNASGDEFFPPDSSLFYFDALQGETLLRYLPNASHEFDNDAATLESALQGLLAWYQRIIFNVPRPHIEWRLEPDGTLRVTTDVAPLQAVLWQAQNPTARDFRFNEVGGIWLPMVPDVVNREFVAHIAPPVSGWTGAFIELAYGGPPPLLPQLYSTQVFITPTRTPFALDQPINNPRGAFFWSLEVAAALGGGARWYKPAFDAETLQSFLPVRVFNQYISTLEEARTALGFKGNIKHRALRQCLAVRLNIEAEKIDWYSPVRFSHHKKKTFLWKRWNKAHRMFLRGRPGKAAFSCAVLNYQ